ncbi:hypothetical protein NDU88_004689 [Pleurodeles waltl]|uniref:Secreted protein n=1 Tax=Pleurodeles waltl TaxID=8319 RepID=A0AAV7MHB3_PLEWA|nr:hypothetical protein NDU88_004689 [Pleurodeles waltl]
MVVPRPIGWWRVDCLSQSLPLLTDSDSSFTGAAATGAAASSSGASLRFTENSPRRRIHTYGPVHWSGCDQAELNATTLFYREQHRDGEQQH